MKGKLGDSARNTPLYTLSYRSIAWWYMIGISYNLPADWSCFNSEFGTQAAALKASTESY